MHTKMRVNTHANLLTNLLVYNHIYEGPGGRDALLCGNQLLESQSLHHLLNRGITSSWGDVMSSEGKKTTFVRTER